MAITNGYATLAEAKQRIWDTSVYTATTLAFVSATKKITDSAYGLKRFLDSDIIQVSGSTSNDGYYNVATGNVAAEIVTTEALTDEAAGDTVTITNIQSQNDATDPSNDNIIEQMVEAASRWIDEITGKEYFGETETRNYVVGEHTDGLTLWLDKNILSVTTLTNGDGTVISSSDYSLLPLNADRYDKIKLHSNSGEVWQYTDDPYEDAIQVAGSWGDSATTPANVKEACLLLTSRLWQRKSAILGVAGSTSLGEIRLHIPHDPDILALLPKKMPWGLDYGQS